MDARIQESDVISMRLDEIGGYLSLLHEYIASQQKELDEWAEVLADGETDEFGDLIEPFVPGRFQMRTFATILCNTGVSAICTYAEVELLRLVRMDFMRRQRPLFPIRSQRRLACVKQLENTEQIEDYWKANNLTYTQSSSWSDFKRLKQIRNRLAHSNGWLEADRKSEDVRRYVAERRKAGRGGLAIQHSMLVVEPSYCDEARDIIQKLLVEVAAGIP